MIQMRNFSWMAVFSKLSIKMTGLLLNQTERNGTSSSSNISMNSFQGMFVISRGYHPTKSFASRNGYGASINTRIEYDLHTINWYHTFLTSSTYVFLTRITDCVCPLRSKNIFVCLIYTANVFIFNLYSKRIFYYYYIFLIRESYTSKI